MIKEESDIISKEYYITNKIATFDDAILIYRKLLDGEEISDEWKTVLNYYNLVEKDKFKRVIKGIKYSNRSEKISEKNIEKMYGKRLKTSISRLEQYRRCPFSFHLKYGLKLKEKSELKMQTIDTGTFMHEVIDEFFEVIENEKLELSMITDEEIQKIVEQIIEEVLHMSKYYVFSSTAKFNILTRRLKKVVLESINYIVYTIRNSRFSVLGHELEFSNNGKYKPIIIDLQDGKKIEITGKIDRVDLGTLGDKNYVRIIDYKSSIKNLDMKQVEAGLQIQLITYLDAISKQENFEPSGVLYLGLIDTIYKAKKNMTDDEIKNEIRKKFRMKGVVLADINIIKMMDTSLENGVSNIIPVTLKKDGEISVSKSNVIDKEEFSNLQNKVDKVIKEISAEILAGKIDIKPFYYDKKTACDYCVYKPICMFNPNIKGNEYSFI